MTRRLLAGDGPGDIVVKVCISRAAADLAGITRDELKTVLALAADSWLVNKHMVRQFDQAASARVSE